MLTIDKTTVGDTSIGRDHPLALIAGPCVIESRDSALEHAESIAKIADARGVSLVFKSSFDKANRTAHSSFRGPGRAEGLRVLADVREQTGLAVLTDVHETAEVQEVADVVDVLQIPAFLCRQTDLVHACAASGKAVSSWSQVARARSKRHRPSA